jgi:hypothetical protein
MKNFLFLVLTASLVYGCSNSNQNTVETVVETEEVPIAFANDMENALSGVPSWINEATVVKMPEGLKAHSGEFVSKVSEEKVYSYAFRETLSNINEKLPVAVIVKGWVYSPEPNTALSIVVDINDEGKSVLWKAYSLTDVIADLNQWKEFSARFTVDQPVKPEHQLKVFGFGGKKTAYFDDLDISFEY